MFISGWLTGWVLVVAVALKIAVVSAGAIAAACHFGHRWGWLQKRSDKDDLGIQGDPVTLAKKR